MPKTVFISWSGQRSGYIAKNLYQGLLEIFPPAHLRIWLSAVDMKPGDRWLDNISHILEEANYGILCLTPENLARPWIHFEAGAISKAVGSSSVCPYLYEVEESSLHQSPLGQFLAVKYNNKEANKGLVEALHGLVDTPIYPPPSLEAAFDAMWLKLEERLSRTPSLTAVQPSERNDRDILEEILKSVRGADVHSYLEELGKSLEDRSLGRDELPTALNTVVQWVLQEIDPGYTRGNVVDYEIAIGGQPVLIESKMGNLGNQGYLQATLDQVKEARNESTSKSNARAIIVIPDYPDDVARELNRKPPLDKLYFCQATKLKEHLYKLKQDAAEGSSPP
jgi:hypothetical protein